MPTAATPGRRASAGASSPLKDVVANALDSPLGVTHTAALASSWRAEESKPRWRLACAPWNSTVPNTATAAVAAIASERTRVCTSLKLGHRQHGCRAVEQALAALEERNEPVEEQRQQAYHSYDERRQPDQPALGTKDEDWDRHGEAQKPNGESHRPPATAMWRGVARPCQRLREDVAQRPQHARRPRPPVRRRRPARRSATSRSAHCRPGRRMRDSRGSRGRRQSTTARRARGRGCRPAHRARQHRTAGSGRSSSGSRPAAGCLRSACAARAP